MAHSQGLVNAKALFVKPADFGEAWEKTDLWSSATDIPGVSVTTDDNGVEARRFGSQTSGQARSTVRKDSCFLAAALPAREDTLGITMDAPRFCHF